MGFVFDLPLIVTGPAVLAILVGGSILGLNWFRKSVHPRLRFGESDGDFNAAMVASIMVFYGLATALIAVNVWESYEKVREITKQEAASLAVFYRNASQYPEPVRRVLREEIRAYTDQIIHEAWPLQRRGRIPTEGVKSMDRLQSTLVSFEPVTEAQKALVLETLASYSRMMEARRMRLDSVERRLPGVMWLVIVLGAFISLVSAFYFPVLDVRVHRAQVGLLAGFIGLVIFIILALDRPYDGDLRLKPKPYEVVYEQLMTP
jgi:membrane associated rhomboid family serine protease